MKVTNKHTALIEICGVNLAPGQTADIPPHERGDDWLLKHPYFTEGLLVKGESKMPTPSIKDRPEKAAILLVQNETNLEYLAAWHAEEKRRTVLDAIEKRGLELQGGAALSQ